MGVGNKVLEMELHNHKNTVTLLNVNCFTFSCSSPPPFFCSDFRCRTTWNHKECAFFVNCLTAMKCCTAKYLN
jgi:hypothetical protein